MAESNTKQYRFVGSHADTLANGRPVEPGEFVDLTEEDLQETQNEHLSEAGWLLLIEDSGPQEIATEAATKLANSQGVDLKQVSATGASGLVTKEDVETYLQERDKEGGS